jgi:hypothetical protein
MEYRSVEMKAILGVATFEGTARMHQALMFCITPSLHHSTTRSL